MRETIEQKKTRKSESKERLPDWMKQKSLQPGVATVEASFVVSLCILLLGTLLYLGMILHDRAILTLLSEHYLESIAAAADAPQDTEGRFLSEEFEKRGVLSIKKYKKEMDTAALKEQFGKLVQERVLITALMKTEIEVSGKEIILLYQSKAFVSGGLTGRLLERFIGTEQKLTLKREMQPETFVRLCRGLIRKEE